MPKLYIPEISDVVTLTSDWTFDLYNESRNESLMELTGDDRKTAWSGITSAPCTIPSGAQLKIDRVYIRKGLSEFSSVSFLWVGKRLPARTEMEDRWEYVGGYDWSKPSHTQQRELRAVAVKIPAKPIRFWAKLADVNKIEFA